MPNWRRSQTPGGTFFFTVVTDRRSQILTGPIARRILGSAISECQKRWPFTMNAIVLLPDHLHTIWSLPAGDTEYPKRWGWIKKKFTKKWLSQGGAEQQQPPGRTRDERQGVWLPKYWEHTIESEQDFEAHFDHIHYNPVDHGLVKCPRDWPWSSFDRWVQQGVYEENWACWEEGAVVDFREIEQTVGE